MNNHYNEIDLSNLFKKIIRNWWVFVLIVSVCVIGADYYTKNYIRPLYETSSTLFIGKEVNDESSSISETIRQGTSLVEDYKQLVRTDEVLNEVITSLNLKMSSQMLSSRIGVVNAEGSRFIYLSFTDSNPERCAAIANKISEVLKVKAEEVVKVKNVYIVDYAKTPEYPISPSVSRNRMVAGLFGFMMSGALSILLTLRTRKIEYERDIENITGVPTIGVIPRFKGE